MREFLHWKYQSRDAENITKLRILEAKENCFVSINLQQACQVKAINKRLRKNSENLTCFPMVLNFWGNLAFL